VRLHIRGRAGTDPVAIFALVFMDTRADPPQKPDLSVPASRQRPRRIWPWFLLIILLPAGLVIWRHPWMHAGPGGMPGGAPGGPPGAATAQSVQSVSAAAAARADIPIMLTSLGTVTSLATVTIKSQISGYLMQLPFHEGEIIKKGDLLAQVDPRPYQALLAQYQGQLAKDQALLDNARLDLQRYQRLIKQDSTSKQTLDTAAATVREYVGTVEADQAQVDTEKLNLIYCHIVSPIAGRVGLRQVDIGNYVTASDTDGIVVVTQITPISVVFTLPEDSLRRLMKRLQSGASLRVFAYDRASTEKLAEGVLDSIDSEIDTTTGTVKLRALFPNKDGSLFPNQFVNVTLLLDTLHDAVTVPDRAVQTGTPGTFVYRLNADDTVSLRKITTGPSANGLVAVLSGLSVGDRVVVDGLDHLSDGAKVSLPAADAAGQTPGTTGEKPAAR
jgi:membrane fusion protein, multidrug efflux system